MSDSLASALEQLKQTPAPNYPIDGYEIVEWKIIHAFVDMLRDDSNEVAELVAGQILEIVLPVKFSDGDFTSDQLRYQYAVASLRESARDIVDRKGVGATAQLFVKREDYEQEVAGMLSGIEFIQSSLEDIRKEIRRDPLDGFSLNFGPIGIPLNAVTKSAGVASSILAHVAGIDAIALSLQLQGMASNARLALRQALSLQGIPDSVTGLLRDVTERAAATADLGLGVLRRAVQALGDGASSTVSAAVQINVARTFGLVTDDVAVDLGTSKLQVFAKGRGVVVESEVLPRVRGANPTRLEWLSGVPLSARPMIGGAVADAAVTEAFLKRAVSGAQLSRGIARPTVLVAVPSGATAVERRALQRVVKTLPAKKVRVIDAPIAAAAGAGMNVSGIEGCMIADIGAGKTEISVVALNGLIYSRSIMVGGDDLTIKLQDYIFRTKGVSVSLSECELIKRRYKAVRFSNENNSPYEIVGFDKFRKLKSSTFITDQNVEEAIAEPVTQIIEAFKVALEATPPEIADAAQRNGLMLTGGGALLSGLAEEVRDHTGLPVSISVDPASAVIRGLSLILEDPAFVRLLDHTV
tara:strand:- start:687 stop:2432 length:1746 start_codon:yes stop_codon:yes gene_type:complete